MSLQDDQRRSDRAAKALKRERVHFTDMAALAATEDERDLWLSMAAQIDQYFESGAQSTDVPLLELVETLP